MDIHPHYEFTSVKDYMPTNWFEASVYLEHAFYHTLNSEKERFELRDARIIIIDARERINEAAKEEDYKWMNQE